MLYKMLFFPFNVLHWSNVQHVTFNNLRQTHRKVTCYNTQHLERLAYKIDSSKFLQLELRGLITLYQWSN
jgi:hypothetical protein